MLFAEADHLLLHWPLGTGVPPPLFADGYFDTVIGWIHATVAVARARGQTLVAR